MPDNNPFQAMLNPNAARAGLWDLRLMSAASRADMYGSRAPHSYRSGLSGTGLSYLMGAGQEPDLSGFTFNPAMRQQAINAGVTPLEASAVKRNVILPNTGFFGNHPRLSAAIEGGLLSGLASHGGNTPGESIQGVIEGLVGGQRVRRGLYNEQFAKPFEAADIMANLQDRNQRRDLQAAQIKHYQDEAEIQRDRIDLENQKKDLNRWGVTPVEGGAYISEPGQRPVFQAGPGKGHGPEGDLDIGTREQLRMMGVDPGAASPAQIAKANAAGQQQAIARGAAMAGGKAGAEIPYKNYDAARSDHYKAVSQLQSKLLKSDDPQHLQSARDAVFRDWMIHSMEAQAAGQKAPSLPGDKEARDYINQNNLTIQQQIADENSRFENEWPQALERPGAKSPSRKTGSKTLRYNPETGQLE